jgi:multiple sugar transport system substrate-binding protein
LVKSFIILLIAVLLAACSGNSNSSGTTGGTSSSGGSGQTSSSTSSGTSSNEPAKDNATDLSGELTVALWDASAAEVLNETIAEFNKLYPNIKITVNLTPWSDYWTSLQTSLAGGAGPDVFWMNGPNVHKYSSLGQLKPLDEFMARDGIGKSDYNDALITLYSVNDTLYGMPYFSDVVALYYNKKLFDDANVPYPDETWTWDVLRENAKKLTDESKGIFGYIAPTGGQIGYYNLIHQAGGYVISEDMKKSGFDTPEALEAIQFMLDLMYVDKSSPNAFQQLETPATELFASNRLAMFPAVSPNTKTFYEALGENLGIAMLPAGKQKAAIVHGIAWVMNGNTKQEEAAWAFIKFLGGETGQSHYAKIGAGTPALKSAWNEWANAYPTLNMQAIIDSYSIGVPYPISKNTAEWNVEQNKYMEDILTQKIDPATGLKELAGKVDAILAAEQ